MIWMVLTDAQWAVGSVETLGGSLPPHRGIRRTMEAIIRRCQNGAKWRRAGPVRPLLMAVQTV